MMISCDISGPSRQGVINPSAGEVGFEWFAGFSNRTASMTQQGRGPAIAIGLPWEASKKRALAVA